MADSVEEFKDLTRDLLIKLHEEIQDTAEKVAYHAELPDDGGHRRYSQLRIDLLSAVFAALMVEHTSLPTLELRYVPAWAHDPSLAPETVEVNIAPRP